jgi:hypothetical protein
MTSIVINPADSCIDLMCGAGETDVVFSVKDIYSTWKNWLLEDDNSKYLQAFDSVGNEPLGGGENLGEAFFLLTSNNWKICPNTTEAEVRIVLQGNLFASPATDPLFDYDEVAGKCYIELRTSTLPSIMETGVSGLTNAESTQLGVITQVQSISNQILTLNQKMNKLIALIPAGIK